MNKSLVEGIQHVYGTVNVAELYGRLFKNHPSFVKESYCCKARIVKNTVFLTDHVIFHKDFETIALKVLTATDPQTCPKCRNVNTEWKMTQTGNYY